MERDRTLRGCRDWSGGFVGGSEVLLVAEEAGGTSEGAGELVDLLGLGWWKGWTDGWLEVGWRWRSRDWLGR